MSEREIESWITIKGNHVPIYKGESKQDAVNRYTARTNEDKKQKDIKRNQDEADKLNGKTIEYKSFKQGENPRSWMKDNTNWSDWGSTYDRNAHNEDDFYFSDAVQALRWYTGGGYGINYDLYNSHWQDISDKDKKQIDIIKDALNRSEIYEGLQVTRQCDFQIFGAKELQQMSVDDVKAFLSKTDGIVQNDSFMSFSADTQGVPIMGRAGLVIHLMIPPSKGAGMYIADFSTHEKENEFLLNNNAILKFDIDSIREVETPTSSWLKKKLHINAYWLGQADKRTID